LPRNFFEINFDNKNTDLKVLISKKSFEDTSEKITKELLKKIAVITEKEYGIAFKECYSKLLTVSQKDLIFIENGIVLINQTFEKITNNFLTLLRLAQPVYLKKELSIKTDIIFTVLTPKDINTSNKLQLLSKISTILNRNNIKKKITGIKKAEDVLAILMNA
jgi:mannitol/fructose-specific phosphotransferase system IIA component (Ntr-type)|tara:strand:+ start:655 stop:1143 length:489 start_codon:yes stop_codon:yes gene_type:complete